MNRILLPQTCRLLMAVVVLAVSALRAEAPQDAQADATLDQVKPRWQLGDQWTIETTTLQLQRTGGAQDRERSRPVSWQFTVKGVEKLHGHDCWRIEVRPLVTGRAARVTTFWADCQSLGIRQFETQLPLASGFSTMTESYEFPSGQPAPVQGPLSVLPIDLPLFLGGRIKGSAQFNYEAVPALAGQKAVGEIGFSVNIQQDTAVARADQVKGLLADAFTKDLETRLTVEVQLKSPQGHVRQLWQPGLPWPVYADNGTTISRLIKVTPGTSSANPRGSEP